MKQNYANHILSFKNITDSLEIGLFNIDFLETRLPSDYSKLTKRYLFYRPPAIEFSTGAYQSLINNGESIAYRNPQLFMDIQEIQIKIKNHLTKIYESIESREDKVMWKWNKSIRNIHFAKEGFSDEMIYDLDYFYDYIAYYYLILDNAERYIENMINDLKNELSI